MTANDERRDSDAEVTPLLRRRSTGKSRKTPLPKLQLLLINLSRAGEAVSQCILPAHTSFELLVLILCRFKHLRCKLSCTYNRTIASYRTH
jgi:hypothetical protein